MKMFAKQDLIGQAKKLTGQGYKNLTGTNDGQFFTDPELATAHAKKIGSEVFKFSSEDFENVSEDTTGTVTSPQADNDPDPVKDLKPETKRVSQPKKK